MPYFMQYYHQKSYKPSIHLENTTIQGLKRLIPPSFPQLRFANNNIYMILCPDEMVVFAETSCITIGKSNQWTPSWTQTWETFLVLSNTMI